MSKSKKLSALVFIVFVAVAVMAVALTACDNTVSVSVVLDFDGGVMWGTTSYTFTAKAGEKTDLSEYVPTKNGYSFAGWTDGVSTYSSSFVPTKDVTLKAVWLDSSANSTLAALKAILASVKNEDGAFAFTFEGNGKDEYGNTTGIALKARVSDEEDYTIGFELSDGKGDKTVGVYVMDGAFYVWSPELGGIALEDFDMNYLLQAAVRVPDLLGNMLGGINVAGMNIDTLLGMLFTMFTKSNVRMDGDATIYSIEINPIGLQGIASLLNLINLDSILQGAGLNIKTSGFINWFKEVLPDMSIKINATIDNETGKLSGMTSDATYEGDFYFDFSTVKAGFFPENEIQPVEPDVLEGYQIISLGNIDLSVNISAENDGADLGALINAIAGKDAIAKNTLMLTSGLNYRLDLKTSLDIAQKESGDNNYIVLELYEIKSDGTEELFIGAYYKQGNLYVDVAKTLGGIYGGKGIKIGIDLSQLISGVKEVVTDALDKTFFTEDRALNGAAKFDTERVTALSGSEGNYYVSGGVFNFIQVLVGIFGVDGDKVSVTDGTDDDGNYSILNFEIDDEFLTAFLAAIGTKTEIPAFGALNLGVKLNDNGLSALSVNADLAGGVKASLLCDSFSIGRSPEFEGYDSIADYIDAAVGDESRYTYSVKELVGSLLEGVTLDVGAKLSLAAGRYNIMDILSLFGLENGKGVATPWTVSADSAIDARLTAELALDPSTNKLSAAIVLSLNEDFDLGADKIIPAGQLIAVYLSEDGTGYIDLTNMALFGVDLPAMKADIDLSSVIDSLMATLDKDLKFDVSGLFGTGEEETLARLNADGSATPLCLASEVTAEASEIIINSDSLKLNVTLATVSALLEAFGVQFSLPEGLDVKLAASLDGEGLNVDAQASLPASEGYDPLGIGLAVSVADDGIGTGVDGLSDVIEEKIKANTAGLHDAQSNVIKALLGTVGKISLGATIEVSSDEQADLGAYVEDFLKKWLPDTNIDLKIASGTVSLLVALNAERGEYAVIMTEGDGNVIVSARACGETVIVTVADFGSFLLRDTGLITLIENAVNNAIDSIENADLNKLFENLLNPSEDGGSGETPTDPETPEEPETPSEDGDTAVDVISLLGGISVDDAVINIDITREMIASILATLGIEVDFVSAGGTIDIVNGKADVTANIGEGALELGIGLTIGRTDDEAIDYGFAADMLKAYGDEGFEETGENDAERLREYVTAGLKALGAYRSYMESWSLSALSGEYTRYSNSDGVLVFTSREDLKQYLIGLLEGVSLEADVTLEFTPGEYNILELVGKFVDLTSLGLPADSSLIVSFGEPSIDLSVRFNSAIRTSGATVDGVMALEIVANEDLALGTTVGDGEGTKIISAGEALLAVYIRNGSLYIDVTALEVLGLSLPVFKADNFDLPAFLYNQIENAISGLFADGEAESENGGAAGELAMANGDGGNVSLIIARNRLELSATMSAVGAILANFLTGDSAATVENILGALGGIAVDVSLIRDDSAGKGIYNFTLAAKGSVMQTVNGEPSELSLAVNASTADIKAGDETLYDSFGSYVDGIIEGYDKTYSDILRGIADNLFKGSMLIDVNVDFDTGKYYLNGLVNNILSALTDSQGISVPIAVETGALSKNLQLALQWNLDPDTKQLKLMFEVRDGDNVLIGAYMYDGELVVDLTGVGLISIKVTNVAVIDQLTETLTAAIDSLQGLDLNEILGGLLDGSSASTLSERSGESIADGGSNGENATQDNAWIAQLLGVVMLENTNIKLALSTQLLEEIIFALAGTEIDLGSDLFDLSANLGILTGRVSFDATLFGEGENALISMSVDASLSNDTIVSNAYIQAVFQRDHHELDATDTSTLIKDVLDNIADIEFETDLSVSFRKGTYNVAELLADFGVAALAGTQLLWTFTEDTDIILTLKVSLKTYSDDGAGGKNGMASVEIVAKNGFKLGAGTFAEAGKVLLGLYAYEDVLYLDASGISLLGISMPVFKVDFDLLGAVVEKLNALGSGTETQNVPVAVASDASGETTVLVPVSDDNGEIVIGINEDEIAITATLGAILAVLSDLNVNLSIDLSAFDLTAAIRIKDGLSIEVGGVLLPTTDGEENEFGLKISIPSDALKFGIDLNALENKLRDKAKKYADYNDDLIETIKQTLGNNSIRAELVVDAEASEVDLNSLISGLLKTLGVDLTIPVNISFDELYYDLEILLNWNISTRQLMLEVNMLGMVNNKTILGIYGDSNDLYLALAGLGLVDLQVKGSPLVAVLFNKLDEAIAGINPIILSDILNDLFYGKDLVEEAENIPAEGEETGTEELATGSNDIIRYLLSAIKITDSQVVADITNDIMSQIFRSLGFDIDFVLEASLAVDLAGDKIEADMSLGGDADISLILGFNGKPDRFIPEDTSKFVVLDTTNAEVDGGQVVKKFLDGFELALALDLKSNSVGTAVDSSEEPTMYTRVELKKVTGPVALDNCGVTVGTVGQSALLLTLYDINESEYYTHGSGSKTAMLHFYLDYASGKATIYLGKGYFKIVGFGIITIDITDYVSNFALNLDILGMLAPTVENLIKQVNDAANNLGQEETPGEETPPSQDQGTAEEVTGIAKVFAELDIEALLRPGINVNLSSTGVGNINVNLDPYELNKMVDGIFNCIFGADTIIDMTTLQMGNGIRFSKNYLSYMWWDRTAASNTKSATSSDNTPYSTWDSIIRQLPHIVDDVLNGIGAGILGAAPNYERTSQNLHRIVKRLLPLAVWNEAEVNVNFVEGTLTNVSFTGKDTGQKIEQYALNETTGEWENTHKVLTQTIRTLFNVVDGAPDAEKVYSYYYQYGSYGDCYYGGKGIMHRTGFSQYLGSFSTTTESFVTEIQIYNKSSAVGDPSYTLSGTDGVVDWGNLSQNITFNPYMYSSANGYQAAVDEYWNRYFGNFGTAVYQKGTTVKRGTISLTYNGSSFDKNVLKTLMNRAGTHTITATANYSDGTTSTMNISIKVKDVGAGGADSVRTVDAVNLHVYESLPDYFTITTYSGERLKYYADGSTVRLTGDYKATSPSGGKKTAYLTFANGASYPVTINYYNSTINDQTIDLSWYDLDFSGSDTQEGKDAVVQALLDRFDMYYADGSFIPEALTEGAAWDKTGLYELVSRDRGDLSEGKVEVTVTFNKRISSDGVTLEDVESALVQKVKLTLNMSDKRKLSVVYDGMTEGNYLNVDPYSYYLYKVTGDESVNPIPSTVTATYADGKKEAINVVTEFGADADWSYMTAKTVKATLKIDPTRYEGNGWFEENMQISININRNIIAAVYFDEAKTQDYVVRGQSYQTATVVFTNGLELTMPVAIVENGDTADVYIGFDVQTYETYGKISTFSGINGTLLQAFTVQIR